MGNRADLGKTAMMVFICLMMIVGGLSEGYPGLAVFGGFILAMLALGYVIGFVGSKLPSPSQLPRPVLIIGILPVLLFALVLYLMGDGELRLWAVLMGVGYLLFVAADFLPESTLTLRQDLPGIHLEGKQAEAVSRALGIELPDPSEAAEGEPIVRTHVTEIKLDAEDLANWQETLLQVALSPHGVKVVRAQSGGDIVAARARDLIDNGQLDLAVDELRAGPSVAESEERRVLLAEALLATGRSEEAHGLLADIPTSTASADAWLVKGEAARALGREEDALDAFEQAAALAIGNPGGAYRLDILPLALYRLGRIAAARTALAGLQATAPDDGSLICVQALLDAQEGRLAEALAALERVVDALPARVLSTLDESAFTDADQHASEALRARARAAQKQRGTDA